MRECFMPVAECLRLSKDDHILTEARILESDVFMHQCMAESMQARAIGKNISSLDENTSGPIWQNIYDKNTKIEKKLPQLLQFVKKNVSPEIELL